MNQNTVNLSLDRYHELLKAEEKANKPRSKSVIIPGFEGDYGDLYILQTDDEVTGKLGDDLVKINEKLSDEKNACIQLQCKIKELVSNNDTEKKKLNHIIYVLTGLINAFSNMWFKRLFISGKRLRKEMAKIK